MHVFSRRTSHMYFSLSLSCVFSHHHSFSVSIAEKKKARGEKQSE